MTEPEGFKGTPGEWEFVGFAGSAGCYVVQSANGGGIASFGGPPGNREAEANATIFAASKDLLAALQWLCAEMEAEQAIGVSGFEDWLEPARAAIAKALAKALPQEEGQ